MSRKASVGEVIFVIESNNQVVHLDIAGKPRIELLRRFRMGLPLGLTPRGTPILVAFTRNPPLAAVGPVRAWAGGPITRDDVDWHDDHFLWAAMVGIDINQPDALEDRVHE